MPEPALELRGLTKHFGTSVTVGPLDLIVSQGEFVTLLGPSGCGKTTTLNMIGGFVSPDAGAIRLAGRSVEAQPPFRRDLGIVFQDSASSLIAPSPRISALACACGTSHAPRLPAVSTKPCDWSDWKILAIDCWVNFRRATTASGVGARAGDQPQPAITG